MDKIQKHELLETLASTEDDFILQQVKAILDGTDVSIWDELNPQLKASIERGLHQSKQGVGSPHDEVMIGFRARVKRDQG
jgi:hypothetical protein